MEILEETTTNTKYLTDLIVNTAKEGICKHDKPYFNRNKRMSGKNTHTKHPTAWDSSKE